MKTIIAMSLGLLCAVATASGVLEQAQITELGQELQSAEPKVRIAAMERLSEQTFRQTAQTRYLRSASGDVLPILTAALGDPEARVRRDAAVLLKLIAYTDMPKLTSSKPDALELRSYPPTQIALRAVIDDPDIDTRVNALGAYTLAFTVPAELQDHLVDRYDVDQKDPEMRILVLLALTMDGAPTQKASALLQRLADAPETSVWVAKAVQDSAVPPPALLPKLVNQLSQLEDTNKRAAIVRSVAKYGAQAKPYLGQLEKAARKENDPNNQQSIRMALKVINEAR